AATSPPYLEAGPAGNERRDHPSWYPWRRGRRRARGFRRRLDRARAEACSRSGGGRVLRDGGGFRPPSLAPGPGLLPQVCSAIRVADPRLWDAHGANGRIALARQRRRECTRNYGGSGSRVVALAVAAALLGAASACSPTPTEATPTGGLPRPPGSNQPP